MNSAGADVSNEAHFRAVETGRARESYNLFHESLYGVFAGIVDTASCPDADAASHPACYSSTSSQWSGFKNPFNGIGHESTPISEAKMRFFNHFSRDGVTPMLASQWTQSDYHAVRDVSGGRRVDHDIFKNYPHGDYVYNRAQRNIANNEKGLIMTFIGRAYMCQAGNPMVSTKGVAESQFHIPDVPSTQGNNQVMPINLFWKRIHRKSNLLNYDYWKVKHNVRSRCS